MQSPLITRLVNSKIEAMSWDTGSCAFRPVGAEKGTRASVRVGLFRASHGFDQNLDAESLFTPFLLLGSRAGLLAVAVAV